MQRDCSNLFGNPRAAVVATIASAAGWILAKKLAPGVVDFLEVRADLLLENTLELPGKISELPIPVILTVRGPLEGGKGSPDAPARTAIYRRYLPQVAAIDLELASAQEMKGLVEAAQVAGVGCIFSHHDFVGTSTREVLAGLTAQARALGADLFKVATTTNEFAQLGTLAGWLDSEKSLPLAAMGMGRLGKISRPLLAQLGSRLNYGYLDAPIVPGQWPAPSLRQFLDSLPSA